VKNANDPIWNRTRSLPACRPADCRPTRIISASLRFPFAVYAAVTRTDCFSIWLVYLIWLSIRWQFFNSVRITLKRTHTWRCVVIVHELFYLICNWNQAMCICTPHWVSESWFRISRCPSACTYGVLVTAPSCIQYRLAFVDADLHDSISKLQSVKISCGWELRPAVNLLNDTCILTLQSGDD
jgi:hypothetical protein